MPTFTVKVGKRNPFESGGPFKLNVKDMIDVVAPERDVPFLKLLGWQASAEEIAAASGGVDSLSFDCNANTHTWNNDGLVPSEGTITADRAAAAVVTVGATAVLYFRADDIIHIVSTDSTITNATADVFLLVTTVNTGAGTLTVSAINTDQPCDSGDKWYLMGNAKKVGSAANTEGKYTVVTQTSNFTQIFSDDAWVTGSDESVDQYGITDPMAREVDKTFQRLMVEFERACLYSIRSTTLPADSTTAARMGGLWYYLRTVSDNTSEDLAGDPISMAKLDEYIDDLWQIGGKPSAIMMNTVGLREFKKFNVPFTKTERTERSAGFIVDRYESALGISLDVILNRHLGNGDFLILSPSQLGLGPLKGNNNSRDFVAREVPWDGGDYRTFNIRGEYTMEVLNNLTHHKWVYGGAATVSA